MRENTTWKTANEISAWCCSMRRWWNELFRAGGWPWTGMEPDKEAGGGGSFEQMKENVSYGAGRKHHLFFFFLQFLLQLLQLLLPEFSSFPSFPLLLIVVYSYFLHFHLHLDLPPHCSFSTMLLEFFSLISAIRWCLSSSSLCVISFFFFFLSFHFFSSFFSWSFDPFSSVFHFHFWLLLSTSTYTFDSRFTSLLLVHPAVRITVIKSRRSLSMFA